MFNIGAWGVMLTYIAELLPSDVRSAGISACMLFGNLGVMIAPIINASPFRYFNKKPMDQVW